MPITETQKAAAEQRQWQAARDGAPQVRIVAGPGTGKSRTIEKRIADLLANGANPDNIYVISFTRATCGELSTRIQSYCGALPCAQAALDVRVSTMHSLALKILRRANLLNSYPSTPIILDNWEQSNIYDRELATSLGCTPTRAKEIRNAHDAQWQTLNPEYVNQAQITPSEVRGFNAFHVARTNLYSCVLPGEVIFKCVDSIRQGVLQREQLPRIDHLIVDEYQDLNACDQEFIRLICQWGTVLFIAGDDDQSIYMSLRHANPDGIVQFPSVYPASTTHILTDCFRCTQNILNPASNLIQYNPNRVEKNIVSLYSNAVPPIQGQTKVWSFQTAQDEARAIARSCQELITAGMSGREDDIIILICNRRVQLDTIAQELGNLGLPYDSPRGATLTDEYNIMRAIYSLLRIINDNESGNEDYPAHRDLLELLNGVGTTTAKNIADACITNQHNFRQLFYLPQCPAWITGRSINAVERVIAIVHTINTWSMNDILSTHIDDIRALLEQRIFCAGRNIDAETAIWNALIEQSPQDVTLNEVLLFLATNSETEQQAMLEQMSHRGETTQTTGMQLPKRIRILTMHGAKGLTGKVVFIPGAEQGLMPSFKSLQATGLVIEQRRLFYVSVTRAMACCIITHASQHTGPQAMALTQNALARLTRSQFLNEMGLTSISRNTGLTPAEALEIMQDINNL